MALGTLFEDQDITIPLAIGSVVIFASLLGYLFYNPPLPKNAPQSTPETWPIIGAWQFFTQRWDFYQKSLAHTKGGHFSFYAVQYPVVALAGDDGRKTFFESKSLGFAQGNICYLILNSSLADKLVGYAALLGGSPSVKENNNPLASDVSAESGFSAYFNKRLINMLKGNQLAKGLPQLIQDARGMLDELAAKPEGITDPFDSIYRMVFKLTMRTVACNEIANDSALLERTLKLYEDVEGTATPLSIMYPWLPTPSKFKRLYSGSQLYMIFKRVVDDRKKEDRKEGDALQYLIDQGDSITDIIEVCILEMED